MNKKMFMMAVAAILMLATMAGCKGKSDKVLPFIDESEEMEELDDEEADADDEQEEDASTFLSQDLATFDLRGPVRSVSYDHGEHGLPCTAKFDRQGHLVSLVQTNPHGDPEEATVYRDVDNIIETISFESDDPWVTILSYDGTDPVPTICQSTNQMGNYTQFTYHRDAKGRLVSVDFEEAVHGNIIEGQPEPTVKLTGIDSHGNWTKCTIDDGAFVSTIKRAITYRNEEADGDEANDAVTDRKILDFIAEMYDNDLYMDDDFLKDHCTPRLLRHLRDEYDYEGEGLASWLFRTSAQEPKPGYVDDDDASKILSTRKGADGWYHYKFLDGGWSGENRIKAFVKDGKVWMDYVESVYDETANR